MEDLRADKRANQDCVTLHAWLCRADKLTRPDRLVVDLDPAVDDFAAVRAAARWMGELLSDVGLTPYVQTTGSRGLHVVAPLDRSADFDATREFARDLAEFLAGQHPDELTTRAHKAEREKRIYLDVMRNSYAQTAVCPYSVRALPDAPIATPVGWQELDRRGMGPRRYTLLNMPRRLARTEDPWAGMDDTCAALSGARTRLDALRN